jgi:tetratricopeptide (TPR) repeat protein
MIGAGDLQGAERLLMEIGQKNGEWYFLYGSIAYRKGWLDEAMQNYTRAVQMDPNNMEYRQALNMMQQRAGGYSPYNTYRSSTECDPCSAYLCLSCLTPWGGMCC